MNVSHDETNDLYSIEGMTVDEIIELDNVFDSCQLPQKRIFHTIRKNIGQLLDNRNKVNKNADK